MENNTFAETQTKKVVKYHADLHKGMKKHFRRGAWLLALTLALFVFNGLEGWLFEIPVWLDVVTTLGGIVAVWLSLNQFFQYNEKKGEHTGFIKSLELLVFDTVTQSISEGLAKRGRQGVDVNHKAGVVTIRIGRDAGDSRTGSGGSTGEPNFKKARLDAGLSQVNLAKKSKVSLDTVRRIEKDWKAVGLGYVKKVADTLGMNIDWGSIAFVDKKGGKVPRREK